MQFKTELPEKGLPSSQLLQELRSRFQQDLTYKSGTILSSMCTEPNSLAKRVYQACIEKNAGDPTLFPSLVRLEKEIISMIGSLLSNPGASGYIVSGGTEANVMALWVARNLSRKERPEVILPMSAHVSLDKAADLLNMKPVKVSLNDDFEVDVGAVENVLNDRTAAMVGIAGTTDLGVVDPIAELSELAVKHDVYLHVDAAFGGFVLPFLKELGYPVPDFDFSLPGVSSITVDPHKMGMAPISAGGILFRDDSMTEVISVKMPYMLKEVAQATILGTRSGASIAATWAVLNCLGKQGYARLVKRCMSLTHLLAEAIDEMPGVSLVRKPVMNIIGMKPENMRSEELSELLWKRGWAVGLSSTRDYLRMVIMPHLRAHHIRRFLADLASVLR